MPGVAAAKVLKSRRGVGRSPSRYHYFPEWWFVGAQVQTLTSRARTGSTGFYSARARLDGGDGIGLDGRKYHIASTGSSGWITERGRRARSSAAGGIFAPFCAPPGTGRAPPAPSPSARRRLAGTVPARAKYDRADEHHLRRRPVAAAALLPQRRRRSVTDPAREPRLRAITYKPLNKDGWFRATTPAARSRAATSTVPPPAGLPVRQRAATSRTGASSSCRRRTSPRTSVAARMSAGACLPFRAPPAGRRWSAGRPP